MLARLRLFYASDAAYAMFDAAMRYVITRRRAAHADADAAMPRRCALLMSCCFFFF